MMLSFLGNAWYCAAFGEEVGAKPLARLLLDKRVLLARDAQGVVRAIGDMCPHRFAPLHRGQRFGDSFECPYHGLRFDLSGNCVRNPHGSGRIPAGAHVPSYPVVERDGVVWFWPGDPALADPEAIIDLRLFPRNGPPVGGHLQMPVDYRLIIDNLLDLTHAPYLHAGVLSPAQATREASFDSDERSIRCRYLMRDVETPSSQAIYFSPPRGDYYSEMEWTAPATLRQRLAMTETHAPAEDGGIMQGAHLITPETVGSTHYFWLASRNRLVDDEAIDRQLRAIVTKAFTTEDEPMIAACQDYMAGREFFSMKPLYLETDHAAARCRRILQRLIAHEHRTVRVAAAASFEVDAAASSETNFEESVA